MARGFGRGTGKAPTTAVNGAQAAAAGAPAPTPAADEVKGQVLVPSDRVGKIIGRGGQKIKDIQHKSGAIVKVSDDVEGDCKIVYLRGSAPQIQKAEEIITSILSEVREEGGEGGEGRQTLDLWIPEDKCGLVIGSRGSKIREIQGDSGARVNVGRRDTAEDGMIRVSCSGSLKACEIAKQIIEDLTADYPEGEGGDAGAFGGQFGDNAPEAVVEIYIHVEKCGKVIGSRGSKIHEIQDDTGAQVDVGRKETAVNGKILVTLSGGTDACAMAKETIEALVAETGDREQVDSGETLEMWIREKKCGLVIGAGGSQIKDIQIDSGARVKIGKRDTATGGKVMVTLSGTMEQCELAKSIIEELTADKDNSGRFEGGAFGGMAGAGDGQNKIELWVPEKKCGLIIGKGGSKISEIQQQTGTRVNVNGRDTSEDGKCLVTVTGSAEDCAAAEEIINELIASDNAGGGGGGGRERAPLGPDQGSLDVWVETTKLGRVIGKGGFQIREIESTYGVRVDIKKDEVQEYDTKVILTGSEEATMNAKDFIYDLVDAE